MEEQKSPDNTTVACKALEPSPNGQNHRQIKPHRYRNSTL